MLFYRSNLFQVFNVETCGVWTVALPLLHHKKLESRPVWKKKKVKKINIATKDALIHLLNTPTNSAIIHTVPLWLCFSPLQWFDRREPTTSISVTRLNTQQGPHAHEHLPPDAQMEQKNCLEFSISHTILIIFTDAHISGQTCSALESCCRHIQKKKQIRIWTSLNYSGFSEDTLVLCVRTTDKRQIKSERLEYKPFEKD